MSRLLPIACLALTFLEVAGIADGVNPEQERVVEGMLREQAARSSGFESYTRTQHYSVITDRFGLRAEMTARVHRDHLKGKTFEVISRSGSHLVQSRVFDALLAAEVSANQQGELLTPENYLFRLVKQVEYAGRPCFLLESEPRHKEKHLLEGKIWVDAEDFGVVHAEGRPAESLSMWVGRPLIVQDFTRIAGFWWAAKRHSYIDNFLLGKASLVVDYSDYEFEPRPGQPAAAPRPVGSKQQKQSRGHGK